MCVVQTLHRVLFKNAQDLVETPRWLVDLGITSSSYPMIAMWDSYFAFLCYYSY